MFEDRKLGVSKTCSGTLIWYEIPADGRFPNKGAVLECSACGYVSMTGNYHDIEHAYADILRSGS